MELLRKIRAAAGPHKTRGISDTDICKFLVSDVNLGHAIKAGYEAWEELDPESTYGMDENELIAKMRSGWCNFYAEDTINPYVPLFAKGPWIISIHGAVIHDSGGYGMLGFGHNPDNVLAVLSKPMVMANIMTPSLSQNRLIQVLRKEIGHTRPDKICPYSQFILMNSGSEGNSVADRIVDTHTGHVRGDRKVLGVSLVQSFHGRTLRPAAVSDSSGAKYLSSKCDNLARMKKEYNRTVRPNDCEGLIQLFEHAKTNNEFIEVMYIEAIMGEGNPGQKITPEFYSLARKLTLENGGMLVIDSVQAGVRCYGVMSMMDYPGFRDLPCPDFETFSKAINGGQYPVSVLALSDRAVSAYKRGVYGNTMTTAPRACEVVATIVESLDDAVRENIRSMGEYAIERFEKLRAKHPEAITNVTGTGLLYAVHLDQKIYPVVAVAGAEYWLRAHGVGVIHGGENALRFTPHFNVTKEEIDLQVDTLERFLLGTGTITPQLGMIELAEEEAIQRKSSGAFISMYFVKGHIFDKSVINQLLSVIESHGCTAHICRLRLGCSAEEVTEMTLEVHGGDVEKQTKIARLLADVAEDYECAFKPTDATQEALRL
jgi:acetylornithine/succinyldiaminopimelate/putrescine aminotransferase